MAIINKVTRTVRRVLGHASFAATMKLYGGLTAEAVQGAAGVLASAFEKSRTKSGQILPV
jgi:hypothetical protein